MAGGASGVCWTSADREDRREVETLEPGGDSGITDIAKSLHVSFEGFGDQAIFNCCAFLGDLQITVAMGSFEIVVQFRHEMLLSGVVEADFLGQQQSAAGECSVGDGLKDSGSLGRRQKLQGQIQHDQGCVGDLHGSQIGFDHMDAATGVRRFGEVFAKLGHHGGGVVYGMNHSGGGTSSADQSSSSTEGAAQVPDGRIGADKTGSELFDDGQDRGVPGH